MASNLSEVYPAELVKVMNSDEFKAWLVAQYEKTLFPTIDAVERYLTIVLIDPIPACRVRPTLSDYKLDTGRKRTRQAMEDWARRFIFTKSSK